MKFSDFFKKLFFTAIFVSFLAQPLAVFAATPAITGLTANFSVVGATLSWNTPADASLVEFEIRYTAGSLNDGNFNFGTLISGPTLEVGTTQTLSVSNLNSSTSYTFGILTRNFLGEESPIVYVSGSTTASGGGGGGTPIEVCTAPTSATSFQAPVVSASAVSLSWNLPNLSNLSDLEVRYSIAPINDGTFNFATQVTGAPNPEANTTQNFTVGGLASNTNYHFAIKLWNACGEESLITSVSATTASSGGGGACTVPGLPTSLTIGGITANSLNISWTTPNQASLSELEVRYSNQSLNDGNFNLAPRLSAPNPEAGAIQTATATGLIPSTTYYFGLRVQNACGDYSGIVYISGSTNNTPPVGGGGGGGSGGGGSAVYASTGLVINNNATTTANRAVTLSLSANRALEMWISEDKNFNSGSWEPFATTTTWILSSDLGNKTIYARFRDDRFTGFDGAKDEIELIKSLPVKTVTSPKTDIQPVLPPPIITNNNVASNRLLPGKIWFEILPREIKVSGDGEVRVAIVVHVEEILADYFRLEMKYPQENLKLKSVEFAPAMNPDFSAGANLEDSEHGLIIKSVSSEVPFVGRKFFATLVFEPLALGEGNLEILNGANYKQDVWRTSLSVLSNPNSDINLLASLVSPNKENNVSAMFAIWVFFVSVYAGHLIVQKYKKGL